ncbi:MAG: mechanosensitive ion channel family protein [Anaerolineales bacterium]
MTFIEIIGAWLQSDPRNQLIAVVAGAIFAFLVARYFVARGLLYVASRTENKWDDIFIRHLHPYRLSLIAPLIVINEFAYLWPQSEILIRSASLFIILWISVLTATSLLNAVNIIYESRETYSGVSIQGYLDLGKILFLAVAIILTISLFTGQSPLLLLGGLGALTAILLLIFQDTILFVVASVQIAANDLVREGDWIEVPGFNADGDVTNMSLHTIKIQNWDKTFTVIPTHKLMEVSFKNWRGMSQAGGRRTKRSLYVDIQSIRFCTEEDLQHLRTIAQLKGYLEQRSLQPDGSEPADTSPNKPRLTNLGAFMAYVDAYLRQRPDVRQDMTILVRQLDPGPSGLPIEIYLFTNTIVWEEYEGIQASIFNHLLATVPEFGGLRVFQQPTGRDFASLGTMS